MDSLLISLLFFLINEPVNIYFHDAYFFRDSLVEVKTIDEGLNDYNGRFVPPNSIHITTWTYESPKRYWYWITLKTTKQLLGLMTWQRFRILFLVLHELQHYKNWNQGVYPTEDEINLQTEKVIRDNFKELKQILHAD